MFIIKFQREKTKKTTKTNQTHKKDLPHKNNLPLIFEGNLCRLNIEPDSQAST